MPKLPYSRPVIMAVLAFVAAAGGYGGYQVVQEYGRYGADFETRLHVVGQVVDGDTLVIENGIRVRLLGVDAPETGACYSEEAKKWLSALVLGKEILLEKDQTPKDGFDRLLRYVVVRNENPDVDDVFVNSELVRGGFAESMYTKPNRRYLSQLQADEREAQSEEAGMWGKCDMKSVTAEPEREQASDPFSKECVIKGNIDKSYSKNYFLPGCPNYKRVIVDTRKGEKWFCTEKEAQEDGWQKSPACNNIWQTAD
ncbi:MAG: thermonuclease family protein [Patescibacteria group bacterium]|nr:thermonuclease family protein [Patescibacteria group bacterium]